MKKTQNELPIEILDEELSTMRTRGLFDYSKELLTIYGLNINVGRNIPDVRDGLKPVQRRALYSLVVDLKNKPGNSKVKVARVVGETLGLYHPHGEVSVYNAIVDMGRWWKYQFPLIEKQGNYGSIKGDTAAAMRYIECGISEFAYEVYFKDWFENIVEFHPNYSGQIMEPSYFPAALPMVLINGIKGTSYGASVGIPPFNINEVIDLCISAIHDKEGTKYVLAPDSLINCDIVDTDWEKICSEGKGKYRLLGRMHIGEDNNIYITSIPESLNIRNIVDNIDFMIKGGKDKKGKKIPPKLPNAKRVDDISEEKHDADEIDVNIVIEPKRGADPNEIMRQLEKSGVCRDGLSIKFEVVFDFVNMTMNLKSIINVWLDFRRETKRRFIHKEIARLGGNLFINEPLLKIIKTTDEKTLLQLFKKGKNRSEIIETFITKYDLTYSQAETISGFRLYQFSKENIKSLEEKIKNDKSKLNELEAYMYDDSLVDKIILDELIYFKNKYGVKRQNRCKIITDLSVDVIENTPHILIITSKGIVQKVDSLGEVKLNPDEYVEKIMKVKNKDIVILFDENGMSSKFNMWEIKKEPTFINNYTSIKGRIVSLVKLPFGVEKTSNLIFLTQNGLIKKSELVLYTNSTDKGTKAISLKDGDRLVEVIEIGKDKDIIVYTKLGNFIRFNTNELQLTQRNTVGVKALTFNDGEDYILGACGINPMQNYVISMSRKGNAKKTSIKSVPVGKRGGKISPLLPTGKTDEIAGVFVGNKSTLFKVVTNKSVYEVTMEQIPELFLTAGGKKVVKVKAGEFITHIEKVE